MGHIVITPYRPDFAPHVLFLRVAFGVNTVRGSGLVLVQYVPCGRYVRYV